VSDRLRILVVSPFLPHPTAHHGGAVVLGSLLEALGERAEVSVLSLVRPQDLGKGSGIGAGVRRVVEVPFRLQADRSLPGRLLERARLAKRWGLEGLPLLAAKFSPGSLARALRREIEAARPDAVLLEYAQTAHLLPLLRGLPTVLTDYEGGEISATFEKGTERIRRADAERWRLHIQRTFPLASVLQVLCEEDALSLRGALGEEASRVRIEVRPPTIPLPRDAVDPAAAPPAIGFLGNFLHSPNREAARFLVQDVLPRVRERVPAARLVLVGEAMSPSVRLDTSSDGIVMHESTDDLVPFFARIRVFASPAFSGGGVRTKGLAALSHGVPLVTNPRGARGLSGAPPEAVAVVDSAQAAAGALAETLLDPARAARAGKAGRSWMERRPTPAEVAERQIEIVREILRSPSPR